MRVYFEEIGRDRKTWTIETDSLSDATLTRSIKEQRALMSQVIAFHWVEDGTEARVSVGPFARPVHGRIRVEGGAKIHQ